MSAVARPATPWQRKQRAWPGTGPVVGPGAVVLGLHLWLVVLAWQATGRFADASTDAPVTATKPVSTSIVTVSLQPGRAAQPPRPLPSLPSHPRLATPAMRLLAPPPVEIHVQAPTPVTVSSATAPQPQPRQPAQENPAESSKPTASQKPAFDAETGHAQATPRVVAPVPSATRDDTVTTAVSTTPNADEPPLVAAQADRRDCPPAPHPAALRDRGIEGVVRLMVRVDTEGRASEVRLRQASGFRLFDQAALEQARGCRFVPARRGALPVESWVEFPVRFTLRG